MGNALSRFVNGNAYAASSSPSSTITSQVTPVSSNYQPLPLDNQVSSGICQNDFQAMRLEDFDEFLNDSNIVSRQQQQQQFPVFNNCVISNLTVNYYNSHNQHHQR